MGKVLQAEDVYTGDTSIEKDFGTNYSEVWVEVDTALDPAGLADLLSFTSTYDQIQLSSDMDDDSGSGWFVDTGPVAKWSGFNSPGSDPAGTPFTPSPAITSMQFYTVTLHVVAGTPITQEVWVDGVSIGTIDVSGSSMANIRKLTLFKLGNNVGSAFVYFDNVKVGSSEGASDIFSDDFESGTTSAWSFVDTAFTVIDDPGITPAGGGGGGGGATIGRVGIAFDDGPLEPSPTWTFIDQGGDFPDQFVSGYNTQAGRQTLLSQTDTGTATVYINDHDEGLFDPRNTSSPYFGKLDGRQILLQLYDPVAAAWESQFQGWIDNIAWDIDGSAVKNPWDPPEERQPINASIQIECVDVFAFLADFTLTPGLAGVIPADVPAGMEDGVYYAEGHVDDRQIEILTDVGLDSSRYGSPSLASGNVRVIPTKYDPDESALTALRDAVDAEMPFIGVHYCDRFGKYQFRGRYGRFDPDTVSGESGSDWDFTRWAVGDGAAIAGDSSRAQMRVLSFARDRNDLINVAVCYPQGIKPADMPDQVYADQTSIGDYGKHAAPPMSDLLTADDSLSSRFANAREECFHFAKLLVLNKKDPREAITALQVKAIRPDDDRAAATWAFLTRTDISHIVNCAVGYPAGTGFSGASPDDDYYIEGRSLQVRPLNPTHDYVELDLEVSPAVWSMDTHGVFPEIGGEGPTPDAGLSAHFDYAQ